jgi:hypothetical protein
VLAIKGKPLRILGEDFPIHARKILSTDGTRAYCDYEVREIVLDPDQAGREDLLHELIHAISLCLNVEISEEIVQAVARGLWAVCRDNPETMIEYLFGEGGFGDKLVPREVALYFDPEEARED